MDVDGQNDELRFAVIVRRRPRLLTRAARDTYERTRQAGPTRIVYVLQTAGLRDVSESAAIPDMLSGMPAMLRHAIAVNIDSLATALAFAWPSMGVSANTSVTIAVLLGAGVVGAALLLVFLALRRSLAALRVGAARFAKGELQEPIDVTGPLQVTEVAESLNRMAVQLDERLSTVIRQRNEFGAVLTSMVEGVVAVDRQGRILSLNRAAATILRVDASLVIGRSIEEVVRNSALQSFVHDALRSNQARQAEIELRNVDGSSDPSTTRGRNLEVQSAILYDEASARVGAVIVLHDVTSLRRLESVRRDFVANVSHEVKTPVSAIKAAAETLLDDEDHTAADRLRFLGVIVRQADRLDAIVDDLLSLSRIEQGAEHRTIELSPTPIAPLLDAVVETCSALAASRRITVQVQCDAGLTARLNRSLMEQAMVNLLENAIKYSPEDTTVSLSGRLEASSVVLTVADRGRGIAPEHLPRIFERFYRTDKARSRAMGGTGLGLSIVKHIAEAMGGRVSVQSTVGRGSTFEIHLPKSD
jgi:two-component system phosphate regulon sensor histidine kinase PhoR